MAKRLNDSEQWKDPWYRELGPFLRDLRRFLMDDCNMGGIWRWDLKRAAYTIGVKQLTLDDIKKCFKKEPFFFEDKVFLPDFIDVQHNSKLNPAANIAASAIKDLEKETALVGKWEHFLTEKKLKEETFERRQDGVQTASIRPHININIDKNKNPGAQCVNFDEDKEYSYFLDAIKDFGRTDPIGAKKWLHETRWEVIKSLGGWTAFCDRPNDDWKKKDTIKAIKSVYKITMQ